MPGLPTGSMPLISETAATAAVSTSTATMLGCSAKKPCNGSRMSALTSVYMTSMRSSPSTSSWCRACSSRYPRTSSKLFTFEKISRCGLVTPNWAAAARATTWAVSPMESEMMWMHASRAFSRRLVMHYFFAIWEKSATWAKTLAKRFKSFRRFARTSGSSSMTMVVSKNSSTGARRAARATRASA